ncbi:protein kinase [bacterium]|nr:protein kinase [bacterium]
MPLPNLQSLEHYLIEERLVEPLQLQEALRQLGRNLDYASLVKTLEQRTFLTSYQAQKLSKHETEGLRVGRYKLLYRNASGSFARVFRGCSVDDGSVVAIKVLRQRHAEDPRSVTMFRREGELGKRLVHKNIVPIYEVGSDGDQHYFTMEFVEGGNFRDFIKIRRKFAVPEATQYVLDMAEGLEYALGLGLTHRDLKLSNVLLSAQGVAKLVDFGLAGLDASLAAMEAEVDRAIEYATLEKGTGAPNNDPRSDLYFLGAIYFELLTGKPPYPPTKNLDERRQFGRYRDVPELKSVDPSLPTVITDIVDRLMCIDPNDRYQTPTQLIPDLRRALNGGGPTPDDAESPGSAKAAAPVPTTVICIENRKKQQDALREYFSKYGYRVLVLTDPLRALNRVESERILALLLIGDALGAEISSVYQAALARCKRRQTAVVLALSPKQAELGEKLSQPDFARVLTEGVTLRSIRQTFIDLTGVTPAPAENSEPA